MTLPKPPVKRIADGRHPLEDQASLYTCFWNVVLQFSWTNPVLAVGARRPLCAEDVWLPPTSFRSAHVGERARRLWFEEATRSGSATPRMWRVLWLLSRKDLLLLVFNSVICAFGFIVTPLLLESFLWGLARHDTVDVLSLWWQGLGFSAAFCSTTCAVSQMRWRGIRAGIRWRLSVQQLVFSSCLCLPVDSPSESNPANLMSVDSERFFTVFQFCFPHIILMLIAYIFLLVLQVGWAPTVVGLGSFFLSLIFQQRIGGWLSHTRKLTMEQSDRRLRLSAQFLEGVRVLKMYGWTDAVHRRVEEVRTQELRHHRKTLLWKGINLTVGLAAPCAGAFLIFGGHVLMGGRMTADVVFPVLVLLRGLQLMMVTLPGFFAHYADFATARDRVAKFLAAAPPPADGMLAHGEPTTLAEAQCLRDVTFERGGPLGFALYLDHFEAQPGQLCVVCGPVGSGKSSLLLALLGELHARGSAERSRVSRSRLAYCNQEPWILSMTLRSNVICFREDDPKSYTAAVQGSQLVQDFSSLPASDETEIGSRGINISGGQKARVSLARALFGLASSDVFLLDDILSAVDVHVARAIIEEVLLGCLQGKTRVMVLSAFLPIVLPWADRVVVFGTDGTIECQGSYAHVLQGSAWLRKASSVAGYGATETADGGASPRAAMSSPIKPDDINLVDTAHPPANAAQGEIRGRGEGDCVPACGSFHRFFLCAGGIPTSGPPPLIQDSALVADIALKPQHDTTPVRKKPSLMPVVASRSSRSLPALLATTPMAPAVATPASGKSLGTLLEEEDRVVGILSLQAYAAFFREGTKHRTTAAGLARFALVCFLMGLAEAARTASDLWITAWVEEEGKLNAAEAADRRGFWIIGFFLCFLVLLLFGALRIITFTSLIISIGRHTHGRMLSRIFGASVPRFFDVVPTGRLINRLSKDMDSLDAQLPENLLEFLQSFFFVLAVILLCLTASIFTLVIVPVLAFFFWRIRKIFSSTSRELKRLEGISRSPLYVHFAETLSGLTTIRAMRLEAKMLQEFETRVDENMRFFLQLQAIIPWLMYRVNMLASILIFMVVLLALFLRDRVNTSLVGLSLVSGAGLLGRLHLCLQQSIEVENHFTSVERLAHFDRVEQEELPEAATKEVDPAWPSTGGLVFEAVKLRFRPHLPLALDGVSFEVPGGSVAGIVGRTGSGKSTCMLSILRLVQLEEGRVCIDGVDVTSVSLRRLRQEAVTIVPQDPYLFTGTIRENLDPPGAAGDQACIEALEKACLGPAVDTLGGLSANMASDGGNFSVGQKQLLCLARAILRRPRLLLLDEASASVDAATDAALQATLRQSFRGATLLIVAHRLATVVDADLLVCLERGVVAEVGAPSHLRTTGGLVASMLQQAGV